MEASTTTFFDNVTTIANAKTLREVTKQSFSEHPFYDEMMKPENLIYDKFVDDKFFIPVKAGKASNIKYLDGVAGEIDLYDDQLMTKAMFSPAILAGAILYTDAEKEQVENNTDAITSLQKEKTETFTDTVSEIVNQSLYGDGSAFTTLGLGTFAPVSPGNYTVGGLDETSYRFWKSYYLPDFGSWKVYGPNGSGKNLLNRLINAVTFNRKKPTLLLTDIPTIERYTDNLETRIRYTDAGSYGKIGGSTVADDLSYAGIRFIGDRDCDPDTLFALHLQFFKMVVSPGMNMRVSPTKTLERQPMISYNFFSWRHQVVCKRRNVQARADGITD